MFFGYSGEQLLQVGEYAGIGLVGRAVALACFAAVESFGCGEKRPAESVFVSVAVARIDEVFGDYPCTHLETTDEGVEATAHLLSSHAAFGSQLAGYHAAVLTKGGEDDVFDAVGRGQRIAAAAPVAEVVPPFETDEAGFACEELAIDAVAFGDDGTFPLPEWPFPRTVGKFDVTAFFGKESLGTVTRYSAVEQGQEADLTDEFDELWAGVDVALKGCAAGLGVYFFEEIHSCKGYGLTVMG